MSLFKLLHFAIHCFYRWRESFNNKDLTHVSRGNVYMNQKTLHKKKKEQVNRNEKAQIIIIKKKKATKRWSTEKINVRKEKVKLVQVNCVDFKCRIKSNNTSSAIADHFSCWCWTFFFRWFFFFFLFGK